MSQPPYSNYPRTSFSGGSGGPMRPPGLYVEALPEIWAIVLANKEVLWTGILVFLGGYLFQYILMVGIAFAIGASQMMIPTGAKEQVATSTVLVIYGVQFLSTLAVLPLQYGLQYQALKVVRGEQAEWRDIFAAYRNFFGLIGLVLLTAIVTAIGYVLCIVPGLLAAGMTLFAPLLLMDRNVGPVEALETCFRVFRPHMWMSIVFMFVYSFLGGIGVLLCCVGMIFTYPIFTVAIAYHYNLFFPPERRMESAIGLTPPV